MDKLKASVSTERTAETADSQSGRPPWDREPDPCWSCGGEAEARDDIYVRCLDTRNIGCDVMNHSYSRKTWNTRANSQAELEKVKASLSESIANERLLAVRVVLAENAAKRMKDAMVARAKEMAHDEGYLGYERLIAALEKVELPETTSMSDPVTDLLPNRVGITTEYKRGEFYLSHTVWEDGHEEVEIHRCAPEQLFHSFDESEKGLPTPEQALHTCDKNQFVEVFARFAQIPAGPARLPPVEQEPSVHAQDHFRAMEE